MLGDLFGPPTPANEFHLRVEGRAQRDPKTLMRMHSIVLGQSCPDLLGLLGVVKFENRPWNNACKSVCDVAHGCFLDHSCGFAETWKSQYMYYIMILPVLV